MLLFVLMLADLPVVGKDGFFCHEGREGLVSSLYPDSYVKPQEPLVMLCKALYQERPRPRPMPHMPVPPLRPPPGPRQSPPPAAVAAEAEVRVSLNMNYIVLRFFVCLHYLQRRRRRR